MHDNSPAMQIREMILSGDLAPGERVTEAGLAERLGVSRTPIRNALPRIAAEGLLNPVGKRGYAVKVFSDDESWRALQIRALLEAEAARSVALEGPSEKLIGELEKCLDQGDKLFEKGSVTRADEAAYGAMNARFHQLIVDAAGSSVLRGLIEHLNQLPFVAPSVIVFDHVGLRRAYELLFGAHRTHHAIVEALTERDAQRVEMLFREHAFQQRQSMFSRTRHLFHNRKA